MKAYMAYSYTTRHNPMLKWEWAFFDVYGRDGKNCKSFRLMLK